MVESNLGNEQLAYDELQKIYRTTDTATFTPYYRHVFLLAQSEVLLCLNRPEEALEAAAQSLHAVNDLDRRSKFDAVVAMVRAHIGIGNLEEAATLAGEYEEYFSENVKLRSTLSRELENKKLNLGHSQALAASQRARTIAIVIAFGGLFTLASFAFLNRMRRSHQRQLLEKEQRVNRELAQLIEEHTQKLTEEFEKKNELEKQLAEQKNLEDLGGLVGNLAHDFNNLLQVIRVANETLQLKLDADDGAMLETSNQCVETAEKTIHQLLAYSRKQSLSTKSLVFSEYLRNHEQIFRSALPEKVRLRITDRSEGSAILIDESKMTNALLNLLSNSSDAMQFGGEILLSVAKLNPKSGTTESGARPQLEISLQDCGEGMDDTTLQRAFEPYYTTKIEGSGTGLGLASVHGFVEQSGGEIEINSEIGQGTVIRMSFPIDRLDYQTGLSTDPMEWDLSGLKVLLVEDDLLVANSIKSLLEAAQASVHYAENAERAMELLSHDHQIDHVVSDLSMPGRFDGRGLANWISKHHPEMTITVVSGNPGEYENAGIPILTKPFSGQQLIRMIVELRQLQQDGPTSETQNGPN